MFQTTDPAIVALQRYDTFQRAGHPGEFVVLAPPVSIAGGYRVLMIPAAHEGRC